MEALRRAKDGLAYNGNIGSSSDTIHGHARGAEISPKFHNNSNDTTLEQRPRTAALHRRSVRGTAREGARAVIHGARGPCPGTPNVPRRTLVVSPILSSQSRSQSALRLWDVGAGATMGTPQRPPAVRPLLASPCGPHGRVPRSDRGRTAAGADSTRSRDRGAARRGGRRGRDSRPPEGLRLRRRLRPDPGNSAALRLYRCEPPCSTNSFGTDGCGYSEYAP